MNWMKLDYTTDDKMWRGEREGGRKGVSLTDGIFDFFFLPAFDSSRTSESERSDGKKAKIEPIKNDKAA